MFWLDTICVGFKFKPCPQFFFGKYGNAAMSNDTNREIGKIKRVKCVFPTRVGNNLMLPTYLSLFKNVYIYKKLFLISFDTTQL